MESKITLTNIVTNFPSMLWNCRKGITYRAISASIGALVGKVAIHDIIMEGAIASKHNLDSGYNLNDLMKVMDNGDKFMYDLTNIGGLALGAALGYLLYEGYKRMPKSPTE